LCSFSWELLKKKEQADEETVTSKDRMGVIRVDVENLEIVEVMS